MNPFENEKAAGGGVVVSENTFLALSTAGKWARFLAIMGFIGIGIIVIAGLITFLGGVFADIGSSRSYRYRATPGPVWLIGLVYMIMAVIAFFPVKFLNTFASRAIDVANRRDPQLLEEAVENLKSFFKFQGIATIVYIGLSILFFFVMMIALAAGLSRF